MSLNVTIYGVTYSKIYSLLAGLFVTLLVVVLVKALNVIHLAKSVMIWCIKIKQLPVPYRHLLVNGFGATPYMCI